MQQQLTLSGLRLQDAATFANFYPGDNPQVVGFLQQCMTSELEQFVYLWGTAGSGRSHLLQACCHAANEQGLGAMYLPLAEVKNLSEAILEGIESMALIAIDDIDVIAGLHNWEEALFHLYNRLREAQCRLIVAGDQAPAHLPIQLADLRSRLSWGVTFQVQVLSDADKMAALQMRAKVRGMSLPEDVGQFLLRRCPRDTNELFTILDKLDHASLEAQRRLTIPFVKEVLTL
ncbi:MAG: DnaA regulatory inactivator Hda [Legionellales bacterium]|nr:DnaA regulatory inactivator Hda [Legionellales bacterium]|tara:strand:- start:26381 stop:27076 length:696 start_codon:yes stop_codon:yes gene_type:complete